MPSTYDAEQGSLSARAYDHKDQDRVDAAGRTAASPYFVTELTCLQQPLRNRSIPQGSVRVGWM